MCFEIVLVADQFASRFVEGQPAESRDAALLKLREVTHHGSATNPCETGDLFLGQALASQPDHLHLLLDARMGMMIAFVSQRGEVFFREVKTSHDCRPQGEIPENPVQLHDSCILGGKPAADNCASDGRGEYTLSASAPRS